ncbi:MAG: 30S ribosomal protein S3 [Deltaproteobacteria bacterium]|nr:30S ribosomal protein S3 [Deltaproteobacteria bacterium]
MGQKVNPIGLRVGVIRGWNSQWYAEKDYAAFLHEDLALRAELKKKLYHAGVSKILINRLASKINVDIYTARPGIIIGKKGAGIDTLKEELKRKLKKEIFINIYEVKKPEIDSQLVAENVATQLEKRVHFRKAMKRSLTAAMRLGAKGMKVMCAGRLAGAEIARTEHYSEGSVPLHTLRADIDYGFAEALTTFGLIGVKVWINHGEILGDRAGALKKEGELLA